MRTEFARYHPLINFIYFLAVIGFTMVYLNPVCQGLSFCAAIIALFMQKGIKKTIRFILCILPFILFAAVLNPLFNHQGATILAYFPNGNPLTKESVIYGAVSATMVFGVIAWFYYHSAIMTSEKFIYLFGKIIPTLSLIISMTLRFVPMFSRHLKETLNMQRTLGKGAKNKKNIEKIKVGVGVLFSSISWALENAIDTADSMKARGYGVAHRTSFSVYSFTSRDAKMLIFLLGMCLYILAGAFRGVMRFVYFPVVSGGENTLFGISVYVTFFILCTVPAGVELREARKWKSLRQKI